MTEEDGELCARFTGKGGRREKVRVEGAVYQAAKKAKRDDEFIYPIGYQALHKRLEKLGQAAQAAGVIGRPLTVHLLRRSCATFLKAQGADLLAIQRHLRHKSVETTAKYYIKPPKLSQGIFAVLGVTG